MHEPPSDGWAVALHDAERAETPIGSGIVVDTNLVLTCAHVACPGGFPRELWISFPLAEVGYWERRKVRQCLVNGMTDEHVDLALLELVDPVPSEITPATVRLLTGRELQERSWWAYGYPAAMPSGYATHGRVSSHRGHGKVHLATESATPVAKGFSGAAVWSPDYQAVVGIVLEAQTGKGDAQALTFRHADDRLPGLKLGTLAAWRPDDADETALAAWGWALVTDEEAGRHWLPRARGVAVASENGHRFRGRHNALHRLVGALDHPHPSGRPLVVTGSPGVGKSAVLGRLVTTADPTLRGKLPADDAAVRATPGSVACAVHAKGKSALDVAAEIARAAGVGLPAAPIDVAAALRDRLADRPARFNLIVDALDEAADPEQARVLVREVLVPLAHDGRQAGVQVLVGTRRLDSAGDLLAEFGPDRDLVDLDTPEHFAEADLVDYTEATLRLLGDPRPGNPYASTTVSRPVALRIARFARQNFLVAGLVARAHALNDTEPVDAATTFAGDMASALSAYLDGLPPVGATTARLILTALAYAEPPGLTPQLWRTATTALGGTVTEEELRRFARTSAANFLVERADPAGAAYRLFHQALNDELTAGRVGDHEKLVRMWAALGRRTGWAAAPGYLLRFLPAHAAQAGLLDELLNDDEFLLHAELDRVLRVAGAATTERGRARVALLQRTPAALAVPARERSALFSVVDRLDGLHADISYDGAPYYAAWTHARPRQERTVLEGHSQAVYDVAPIPVQGRNLLASAGEDGDVRFWDPLTNQSERVLHCHDDCVRSLCAVRVGEETLLATAGHDGTVRLWDPVSRQMVHELRGHAEWVRNVCAIPGPDGDLLASAGDDWSVRIWDPATGAPVRTLTGHTGWVTAVTHVPVGGRHLVASTGYDGTVRLWDPLSGDELLRLTGHTGWVTTLYAVTNDSGTLIASAGYDGTVRLWDPVRGLETGRFETGGPMTDLCTVDTPEGLLLAATGEDGAIRIWEVATGRERTALRGHASWIRAVCELPMSDRRMLATAGDDGTVRLWDPDGSRPGPVRDGRRLRAVTSLCTITVEGRDVVASTGSDGSVRLWDPADGTELDEYSADAGALNDLCAADNDGETLLVAAGGNGTVQLWSASSGMHDAPMTAHFDSVNAVRALPAPDGTVIASAGDDVTIRLWRPHDKVVRDNLTGHTDWVTALAVTVRDGRPALASADKNGTVRLWDSDGAALWTEHGHSDAVNALCTVGPLLASAGADGFIRLWEPYDGRPHDALTGHVGEVKGLCAVPSGGRELLASVGADRTVRLWDPATGRMLRAIPVHHPALSCHFVAGRLIVGLSEGLIALTVDGCGNHQPPGE